MSMVPRWVIGAGETQETVAKVMEHSIRKNASGPVEVIHTYDKKRPTRLGYPDPPHYPGNRDPTPFSYVRVWAPELVGYQGRVIVSDSDMVVFGDAYELFNIDMNGFDVMRTRACTAVLLIDAEKCRWDAHEAIKAINEKRMSYGQVVQGLCNTPKEKIGFFDQEWNDRERYNPGQTKLLHFTRRAIQPWDKPGMNPLEDVWVQAAIEALQAGAVTKEGIGTLALGDKVLKRFAQVGAAG